MSLILLMSFTGARVWKGNVALFFFICYYKDNNWYPLKNSDTKIDEKHKYVMIFHCPSWQMSRIMMEEIHIQYSTVTSKVIEKNAHGNPLRYESSSIRFSVQSHRILHCRSVFNLLCGILCKMDMAFTCENQRLYSRIMFLKN